MLLEGRDEGVAGRAAHGPRAARRARRPSRRDAPAGGATYPWDVAATGDDRATALKLTFVLSGLADVLAAAAREPALRVRGSAGAGVAYAARPARHPGRGGRRGARPAPSRPVHRGTAAAPSSSTHPPPSRPAVDVWGPVPALDLMRRVKDQFDPDHRLAPGRFVGGI